MNSKFKPLIILLSGLFLLSLTGCNTIVLDPKGMVGEKEKELIIDAILLMSIIVVPVILMTFGFAWKFRASNKKAHYAPNFHHSNVIELFVWGIPITIILVLGVITWRTTHELDPYRPLSMAGKPINIEVVALDWKWLFIYPEQNIASVNFVEFPINVPVNFVLTSGDTPMNAFHIPQLGTQIYAMAGMKTKVSLTADEAKDYFGRAVNINGSGFSDMQFTARGARQEDFDIWVNQVRNSGKSLTLEEFRELAKPSDNNPVAVYSSVADHLFDNLVMSFMMPGMENLKLRASNDNATHVAN